MVQFTKLRLHGFKSFVDPTVMEIGPGMTGIVGPNGCGKSNLVEALRWVMGETSAKRMRGSGMEDVIFSGTKHRPARSTAEVALWLDNSDRTAPAEINDADELEIIRRIERDNGSNYRINSKTVRARDVQILFADASIGANSPAMVSQGRVADLISAKPTQRRLVLEEAAGISGLHARKHEAELKLRAAEKNLTRVEDVLGTMDTQMQGLKKQARQASRYRNLSGHIETAESLVLYLQWQKADTAVSQALQAFDIAESAVREHTLSVTQLTTQHTEKATVLPELRKKEAEAAASLQHCKLAHGMLEKEAQQLDDALRQNIETLEQIDADIQHETEGKAETEERIAQIKADIAATQTEDDAQEDLSLQNSLEQLEDMQENVQKMEQEYDDLSSTLANTQAEKQRVHQNFEYQNNQLARLTARLENLTAEQKELSAAIPDTIEEKEIAEKTAEKEQEIKVLRADIEKLDTERLAIDTAVDEALAAVQTTQKEHTSLTAEIDTLEKMLRQHETAEDAEPILTQVEVDAGMEKALAVALGNDADATEDDSAPIYWTELPAFETLLPLPTGIRPLSDFVRAPAVLARRLASIGVVESSADAQKYITQLNPGQCLVSTEGDAWRWDGLVMTKDAPNSAAIRLEQKNRLADCHTQIETSTGKLEQVETMLQDVRAKRDDVANTLSERRQTLRMTEQELNSLRQDLNTLVNQNADVKSQLKSVDSNIAETTEELASVKDKVAHAQQEKDSVQDDTKTQEKMLHLKGRLTQKRQEMSEQQSAYDRLLGASESRKQQLVSLQNDLNSWDSRMARLTERLSDLEQRKAHAIEQKEQLTARPSKMNDDLQNLLSQISTAETKRDAAADALATAENEAQEIQIALKSAESDLSDAREERAHIQATVSTAKHTREMIDTQIDEKFSCTVHHLLEKVNIDPENYDMPELDKIQDKLERLLRERDNMGPVNLRADIETQELVEQMDVMVTEKDDLIAAITRLRQGISKLNREARERLLKAFDVVNNHFQDLFTRLFGGGTAHLQLTDAEDPLEAGLEIFAQPPGKKMQILSLFSGGEQTLTSIALIFAMFLTNPAPICVLDEIDAPLDDTNVDRVCSLLEEIANETATRFVVISHHRMTMARMDRLYGVTMSERGVSQLVSVDLQQPSLLDSLAAA